MIYITIVDDEPISADGLTIYLENHKEQDWQLHTCYSPKEALAAIDSRTDILIADILMPEIDGIELARRITSHWPMAKVIFLTASQMLRSAQDAIRMPESIDYILKDEDLSSVLASVRRAVTKIEKEKTLQASHQEIETQMMELLPMLQASYITRLLQGKEKDLQRLPGRLQRLRFPLQFEKPVILLLSRYATEPSSDPEYSWLALKNLIQSYLGGMFLHFSVSPLSHQAVWLIQPTGSQVQDDIAYLFSVLDLVQDAYEHSGGQVSFLLDDAVCTWDQLPMRYRTLNIQLESLEDNALIRGGGSPAAETWPLPTREEMLRMLHAGQSERVAAQILALAGQSPFTYENRMDLCMYLLKVISCFAATAHDDSFAKEHIAIPALALGDQQWPATLERLANMVLQASHASTAQQENRDEQFRLKIEQLVRDHMADDLSLISVADQMSMSPSYFSRKFKKIYGLGYAEYVMQQRIERGRELLVKTNMTINAITLQVGYYSSSHFISSFSKYYHMTPNEYRRVYGLMRKME